MSNSYWFLSDDHFDHRHAREQQEKDESIINEASVCEEADFKMKEKKFGSNENHTPSHNIERMFK